MSDRVARYELSFFVGPDSEKRVVALADAIMDLSEFRAVGGGAIGISPLLCACGTPTVICECGDDRCPKCDPDGCPEMSPEPRELRYDGVLARKQRTRSVHSCRVCGGAIEAGSTCFYVNAFVPFRVCVDCFSAVRDPGSSPGGRA